MTTLPAWPWPRMIAHRGAGKCAPENTLAAFRLGAGFGYRAFEFDVKLSADGVPILLHDDTLERTSSGRGRASDLGFGALAQLDAGSWHSPGYAGEPIPALAAIARFTLANRFAVNVEIKPTSGQEEETGHAVAEAVAGLWAGSSIPPLLSSFSEPALAAARAARPELPRALLLDSMPADWLARLRALDCIALDADHRLLDARIIDAAHAAGYRVLCYTVNDANRMETLFAWGIDSLITDAVDRLPASR